MTSTACATARNTATELAPTATVSLRRHELWRGRRVDAAIKRSPSRVSDAGTYDATRVFVLRSWPTSELGPAREPSQARATSRP